MSDQGTDPAAQDVPAGFGRRVVAWIIDSILILIGVYIVGIFLWPDLIETARHASETDGARLEVVSYSLSGLGSVVLGVVFWAYTALQESAPAQATLGKRMMGIRVTDLDGARLSLLTASLRCWPLYLPGLVGMVVGLNAIVGIAAFVACLAVPFTRRKQGLHDMIARCLVVRRAPAVVYEAE